MTEEEFLRNYHPEQYDRPSVTVDMLVMGVTKPLDGLKILLIHRKNHPYKECFALPGGFVGMEESAYTAASRELEHKTGLHNVYLEQLYTMTQPDRDPRMRVIDISYIALISIEDVTAVNTENEALWFDISMQDEKLVFSNEDRGITIVYKLERKFFQNGVIRISNYIPVLQSEEALAFDHAQIVLEGLMRLRNKLEYSDIAFNLLPEEFTLPDLQRVYEIILGKELYKKNFRTKIEEKVEALDKRQLSITGKKSCGVYRYRCPED